MESNKGFFRGSNRFFFPQENNTLRILQLLEDLGSHVITSEAG